MSESTVDPSVTYNKRSATQAITDDSSVIPVQVALRIRPLIARELNTGSKVMLDETTNNCQVQLGRHFFTFDHVFNMQSVHEQVFNGCVTDLIDGFFKGCNVTIFAYGQTGSGKTYTLGLTNIGENAMPDGVVLRTLDKIFNQAHDEKSFAEYKFKVSALEIYQEKLRDLLSNDTSYTDALTIREELGKIRVSGLSEHSVVSVNDCVKLFAKAAGNRTVGETMMNVESSRSHAIYTLSMRRWTTSSEVSTLQSTLEPKRLRFDESCSPQSSSTVDSVACKLQIVDLAGSERCSRTQTEGNRFKEGIKINMGLLALGNVISLLGNEDTCHRHIPS
ncbi:hypothetical protein ACOME3_006091 [Neoechinorhynchus agilis]